MPDTERYLTREPIDAGAWRRTSSDGRDGASVEFLGIVRADGERGPLIALEYEAFEPMAERVIAALIEQARARWPVRELFVRHRVGWVAVGEISVLIGVRSAHRREAFAACQFLIDTLKQNAPIWKREMCANAGTTANAAPRGACASVD